MVELSSGLYRRAEADGALVNRLDLAGAYAIGRGLVASGVLPTALVRSHPGAAARQTGAALGNLGLGLGGEWPAANRWGGGRWYSGGLVLSLPTTLGGQAAVDAEALHRVRRPGDFRDLTQLLLHGGVGLTDGPRRLLAQLALITVLERGRPQIDAYALRMHAQTAVGRREWVGELDMLLRPSWELLSSLAVGFDDHGSAFIIGPRVMIPLILPELGLALGVAARWR